MAKTEKTHPSYGKLRFSRISGGNTKLFGSSVPHEHKIQLTVSEGRVSRELNREWYFDGPVLLELEMSYNQFAEAIASMNTTGVPVTLTYRRDKGMLPPCDFELSGEQYREEFKEQLQTANKDTTELIDRVKELFDKPRLNKAEKEEILSALNKVEMNIGVNAEYVLSCFNEHMEKSVIDAKNEIEAFMQAKMHSLALEKLKEDGILEKIQSEVIDPEMIIDEDTGKE